MENNWLRNARFGLFIHWGLYALPGGRWKGETMDYIGEWIQSKYRIPNREYAELAARFNPVDFDADEWIRLIKAAGMKYIVFTSKHHDGFAMYHSKVSKYNIVDATPFGRDILAELAEACRKHGVTLGIYYSHHLDWADPDGGDPGPDCYLNAGDMSWGNDWDFPDYKNKDFERYFENKALPQITELLTNYGPVGELWCDCPLTIEKRFSEQLRKLVKQLQPGCMINSRIGNGCGDFESLGDNQIAFAKSDKLVECPITLNDTWGFKYDDHNWKTAQSVINRLTMIAGHNANCLLNIGPEPTGRFPAASVDILSELAKWHAQNPDAISGTGPNPFPQDFAWGDCTEGNKQLNFFIRDWHTPLRISGLQTKVISADVPFTQTPDELVLELPAERPDSLLPVVKVKLAGAVVVSPELIPQDGRLRLVPGGELERDGTLKNWHLPDRWCAWKLNFPQGGRYEVMLTTVQQNFKTPWLGAREVEVVWGGQALCSELKADGEITDPIHEKCSSKIGVLNIAPGSSGVLKLRTTKLLDPEAVYMNLAEVCFRRL